MIFQYNIKIPLTYNTHAIKSNTESELHYEIQDLCEVTYSIEINKRIGLDYIEGDKFVNTLKIKIHPNGNNNNTFGSCKMKEYYRILCELDGILAEDEIYAKKFSEGIVDRICKRLSLVLNKHNDNQHLYQPRVEPVWRSAEINHREYPPYIELKRQAFENNDGNNRAIYLQDGMCVRDRLKRVNTISLSSKDINIEEFFSQKDDTLEFLMNEYYLALGTENIKSKFFHLFSIIEFCEKEYEEHNGSSRLFLDEEVNEIIEEMQKKIINDKRNKTVSVVKNSLMKVFNIGRVEKLNNILKWMCIEKYRQIGQDKLIDQGQLATLIKLRNKSFHGTKEKAEDVEKKYADAVDLLLYICNEILDFLFRKSHQCQINNNQKTYSN